MNPNDNPKKVVGNTYQAPERVPHRLSVGIFPEEEFTVKEKNEPEGVFGKRSWVLEKEDGSLTEVSEKMFADLFRDSNKV